MESRLRTGFVTFGTVMMLAMFLYCSPAAAEKESPYVQPPVKLNATLIVPEGKLEGNGYKINPVAYNDGYGNTYGPTGKRVVRGTRRESRALTIDDLLGQMETPAELDFDEIDRTAEFEKVASTIQAKPAATQDEKKREQLRRKPEFVQSIINRHRPAITDCYKQALRENSLLAGKVEVRFALNARGAVSWVEIVQSTIDHQGMLDCIVKRISRWNDFGFGDPAGPEEVYRQVFTFGF